MRNFVIAITLFVLAGCCQMTKPDGPVVSKSLADVVDAIQYAVDGAANDPAWDASKAEFDHWTQACKALQLQDQKECALNLGQAEQICKTVCGSVSCGQAPSAQCQQFHDPKNKDLLCPGDGTQKRQAWCASAMACNQDATKATELCNNAKQVKPPKLASAELSVAVTDTAQASTNIGVLFVAFGGTYSKATTNTVVLDFVPRVRSTDYGIVGLPDLPGQQQISDDTKKLAGNLRELIVSAIRSASREYLDSKVNDKLPTLQRPPLAVSKLEIDFQLVLDDNNQLGIKKTWKSPFSLGLSGGEEFKTTNTLKIIYSPPAD